MFEFTEEPFNQVSLSIEFLIDAPLSFAVSLRGDVGLTAAALNKIDQVLPIVAPISNDGRGGSQSFKQSGRCGFVGSLPLGESKTYRQTSFIHHGVDLAAQSSTRTADGVIRTPFLPPAAC